MRVVVCDTSPIRYLVQINEINLLERLFHGVIIPSEVANELARPSAPESVRCWINTPPVWLEVLRVEENVDPDLEVLDDGEHAAIRLAIAAGADLVVIDERLGTVVAVKKGLRTTGTLGILELAAQRGWIDLRDAVTRLLATNFRCRADIIDALLARNPQ